MKASVLGTVTALTLAVTAPAFAADPPAPTAPSATVAPTPAPVASAAPVQAAPAPAPAPAPVMAPPDNLVLRAARPINLAPEPAPTPWPYKMAFAALVAGACVVAWRKRGSLQKVLAHVRTSQAGGKSPEIGVRVLGRTPMGLRGEIVLVEAGGARVLVGVTATSMTTLALLPDDGTAAQAMADAAAVEEREMDDEPEPELSERARVILGTRPGAATFSAHRYAEEAPPPRKAAAPKPRKTRARADDGEGRALEGQARGLAFALSKRA